MPCSRSAAESDQRADNSGQKAGGEKIDREGDVELLQIGGGIGADGEKGGVANGRLPGEAGEDHQSDADGGVDADEDQLADDIAGENKWRDQKQRKQNAVGDDMPECGNSLMSSS